MSTAAPKDAPADEVVVARYTGVQRVNHWITAALFTLLGLSGLAIFSPYLFFLTGLFGGGQSTRAVHPWAASRCCSSASGGSTSRAATTCCG